MRSAIFRAAGQPLEIAERSIPVPGADQAVIRVHRCGLCASDVHMTSGSPFDMPAGTAPGHEYAGEVVKVGPGGWLKPGDRVTAMPISGCGACAACRADAPLHCKQFVSMVGGYSDYTLIDQRAALRLPDSLSFADGALVEPLASSLRGMKRADMAPGARVAVIGAGAIGAGAIFWARQRGAGKIVAIARSGRNEALARAVGADALVRMDENVNDALTQALGGAPDIVVEGAGARGMMQQSIDLVKARGTIVSLGGCIHPETIRPALAMFKEVSVVFSCAYGKAEFREALATLDAGHVEPRHMISDTIPLAALPARFEAMRKGGTGAKILVDPMIG